MELGSGSPTVGGGQRFTVIPAAVFGGASLGGGGEGGVLRSALGVFLLIILNNGLVLAGVNPDYQSGGRRRQSPPGLERRRAAMAAHRRRTGSRARRRHHRARRGVSQSRRRDRVRRVQRRVPLGARVPHHDQPHARDLHAENFIGGETYNITWFVERSAVIPTKPFGLDVSAESLFEAAAAKIPAGSEELLALPCLSGALAPYWDSNTRGLYFGLSARHGKSHLYRALLERLSLEQRLATTGAEEALGGAIERVRVMGGGSKGPPWRQILADILKWPIEVTRETETTCPGAGLYANIAEAAAGMSGIRHVYLPDQPTSTVCDRLFDI